MSVSAIYAFKKITVDRLWLPACLKGQMNGLLNSLKCSPPANVYLFKEGGPHCPH